MIRFNGHTDTNVLYLIRAFSTASTLVTGICLARSLSESDRGILAQFLTLSTVIVAFWSSGLNETILRQGSGGAYLKHSAFELFLILVTTITALTYFTKQITLYNILILCSFIFLSYFNSFALNLAYHLGRNSLYLFFNLLQYTFLFLGIILLSFSGIKNFLFYLIVYPFTQIFITAFVMISKSRYNWRPYFPIKLTWKIQLFTLRNLSSILDSNSYMIRILILSNVLESKEFAYLIIALSALTPFSSVPAALQPKIMKNLGLGLSLKDLNQLLSNKVKISVVIVGFTTYLVFLPTLIVNIYGEKYSTVSKEFTLILIMGVLALIERLINLNMRAKGRLGINILSNFSSLIVLVIAVSLMFNELEFSTAVLALSLSSLIGTLIAAIPRRRRAASHGRDNS